jgi:alanine or glycine:cation symporter, AGCS family
MEGLTEASGRLAGFLWGNPVTLLLLVGTGLYLTIRLGFVQMRGFRHGVDLVQGKYTHPGEPGQVSHFQALSTALSGTVGTGNIAGVATAIAFGGPGALFWMWVTAFVGMATKFTESTLALKFREIRPDGTVAGGPMYTLLHGLEMRRMAWLFAFFALIASFGIGNMVQANSVVDGLTFLFPGLREDPEARQMVALFLGTGMALLVGLVIIGGITRIARVASTIVPFMAVLYLSAALIILLSNLTAIPGAFATILNHALNPWAVGGAAIGEAIRYGVARGLFSNEAGLGSSAIAHAAARTKEPVREGLVAMLEPFIDTLVICTLTGLAIVVTGAYMDAPEEMRGASLTAYAFSVDLGNGGAMVVGGSLMLFAFSTMIAWSYYGDRAAYFLFGERAVLPYRVVFVLLIVVGATLSLELVWNLSDITNILMAAPNLIALILLAGVAVKLKNTYFAQTHEKIR